MTVGPFDIDNENASMRIKNFSMVPLLSEAAYNKSLNTQHDLYNININNISLTGIDTRQLITKRILMAEKYLNY